MMSNWEKTWKFCEKFNLSVLTAHTNLYDGFSSELIDQYCTAELHSGTTHSSDHGVHGDVDVIAFFLSSSSTYKFDCLLT